MILTLTNKQNLEKDIFLFTFKPQKPLMWKAGQQMEFTLKHARPDALGIKRIFSIASAPFEKNVLVLTHCGVLASTFKKALKNMRIGGTIEATLPEGDFVITDPHKEHTFIAAGVGIAPVRAMLMDLDYHNQPIRANLIYSHNTEHFPFMEEIEELVDRHAHLGVFYNIDPYEIDRGRIKETIVGVEDHPIYMSGIYIRKVASMFDYRDTTPRRVVHDGQTTKRHTRLEGADSEELSLASLIGE